MRQTVFTLNAPTACNLTRSQTLHTSACSEQAAHVYSACNNTKSQAFRAISRVYKLTAAAIEIIAEM